MEQHITSKQKKNDKQDRTIEDLARVRRFSGPPDEFWPEFLEYAALLIIADSGYLLVRDGAPKPWKNLVVYSSGKQRRLKDLGLDEEHVEEIAEATIQEGVAWERFPSAGKTGTKNLVIGVHLKLEEDRDCLALFILENRSGTDVKETVIRLELISDVPSVYQLGRMAQQAKDDVVQFAEALDFMVLINGEKKFMAAAMTFCNELASRYQCSRVSLGWLKGGYIRLSAMSHMERFEKKMDAVQVLETAMEEAYDQDEEILWPKPRTGTSVARDHEILSKDVGAEYIVSLPIRLDDMPVGVVTCERMQKGFSEAEIRGIRLICDQAARRIDDLRRHDRWFGARMAISARENLSKLLGVEHTLAKLIGVMVCIALAILLFGKMPYRIEAPFILRTDDLVYAPSPFDGYIDEVLVQVGDLVDEGEVLLQLDTRELMLEESMAIADQSRYAREAEKSRAKSSLAEMRIAMALKAQAEAKLELIRYRLDSADMKAAFKGIVVEGDLKELLGAPVRKGDVLFKVARIENLYAELEVSERDIHAVDVRMTGELAFVSRPELKFPIVIERIEPVAVTKEEGNIFMLRGGIPGEPAGWWRPGMSGVSKIDVGKANILWILTHRTVDFLRLFLWW